MSKRMILFENCGDCPNSCMRFLIPEDRVCSKMFIKEGERVCPDAGTPDWCPLPKLPEKLQTSRFYADGWNACLDAITGEVEE